MQPFVSTSTQQKDDERSEFMVHAAVIQSWYIRSSTDFKLKLLIDLLNHLDTLDSLSMVLNTMYAITGKSTVYANAQFHTKSIFDKATHDHDRSMNNSTLQNEKENTLRWFQTLEDKNKITVFIDLIRVSGSYIIKEMYEKAKEIYRKKLLSRDTSKKVDFAALDNSFKIDFNLKEKLPVTEYDLESPYSKEVLEKQAIWKDAISKYENEILSFNKKLFNIQTPKKSKKGKEKGKKKGKGDKKSTKSKSSKKSKSKSSKKNKKTEETVDKLQMLPIWIMKYILSMLDKKTLNNAKNVNSYWKTVVQSLLDERKARNKIDKLLRAWHSDIEKLEEKYGEQLPKEESIKHSTIPPTDAKLIKLFKRGAMTSALRPKINERKALLNSIYTTAIAIEPEIYETAQEGVKLFPRRYNSTEDLTVTKDWLTTVLNEPYYDPNMMAEDKLNKIKALGHDKILQEPCCSKKT